MTPYSGSCDKVGPRLSSEMEVVLFHRELYIYIYIYIFMKGPNQSPIIAFPQDCTNRTLL